MALFVELITHPDRSALLNEIELKFREMRGFTLATLNLDHLVKLRHDLAFLDAYRAHSHVVADGNPVVWLSRLAGHRIELIPGSELLSPVISLAAATGTPVALLGATTATLDLAGQHLQTLHPNLQIVLKHAPPQGFDPKGETADIAIKALDESRARLCVIALGAPKQEIFATYAANRIANCGFLSTGAGLDFIAGTQERAPTWVRAIAMEWFWRMASNPRRLGRRYAACFGILPRLTVQAIALRHKKTIQKDG